MELCRDEITSLHWERKEGIEFLYANVFRENFEKKKSEKIPNTMYRFSGQAGATWLFVVAEQNLQVFAKDVGGGLITMATELNGMGHDARVQGSLGRNWEAHWI